MRLGIKRVNEFYKMNGMKITGVVRDPSNSKIVEKEEVEKSFRKLRTG